MHWRETSRLSRCRRLATDEAFAEVVGLVVVVWLLDVGGLCLLFGWL